MRFHSLLLLSILSLTLSCKAKQSAQPAQPDSAPKPMPTGSTALYLESLSDLKKDKIDGSQIKIIDFSVSDATTYGYHEVNAFVRADGSADYCNIAACLTTEPKQCIHVQSAVSENFIPTLHEGQNEITVQCCVDPGVAKDGGVLCGEKKSLTYWQSPNTNTKLNDLILKVYAQDQSIRDLALEVQKAANAYKESVKSLLSDANKNEAFEILVSNLTEMNEFELGEILLSQEFENLQNQIAQSQTQSSGLKLADQPNADLQSTFQMGSGQTTIAIGSTILVAGIALTSVLGYQAYKHYVSKEVIEFYKSKTGLQYAEAGIGKEYKKLPENIFSPYSVRKLSDKFSPLATGNKLTEHGVEQMTTAEHDALVKDAESGIKTHDTKFKGYLGGVVGTVLVTGIMSGLVFSGTLGLAATSLQDARTKLIGDFAKIESKIDSIKQERDGAYQQIFSLSGFTATATDTSTVR